MLCIKKGTTVYHVHGIFCEVVLDQVGVAWVTVCWGIAYKSYFTNIVDFIPISDMSFYI